MSTWVFLRGLTRESRHWGEFPQAFRRALPKAKIVACDLPGNGRLNHLPSPTSVSGMAEALRKQLLADGIKPPYSVLAMSLGAMVTAAWANSRPEELDCAVLINTSMRPFSAFHERLRPGNYASLLRMMVRGGSETELEETILRLTSTAHAGNAQQARIWGAWRRENPISRQNALRQILAASRFTAPKQAPPVRFLVLTSAADGLVDPECSRRLAKQWQTDFAEHPTAGHDLPLDDGDWVAAQVRDWIKRKV